MENLKRQCACNGVCRLCVPQSLCLHICIAEPTPESLYSLTHLAPLTASVPSTIMCRHSNINCSSASRVVVNILCSCVRALTIECGYVMRSVRPMRIFMNCLIYHCYCIRFDIRTITSHIHSCMRNLHQLPNRVAAIAVGCQIANKYCDGRNVCSTILCFLAFFFLFNLINVSKALGTQAAAESRVQHCCTYSYNLI